MTYSEEATPNREQSIVPTVKLIDKIVNYRKEHGKPFFSLEFFPPRNETELTSFWPLMDQLRQGNPLFMDITWHSRTSLDPNYCLSSLAVASSTIERFNHETVLHLTCSDYDLPTMESILNSAKLLGIKNILALRGDLPIGKKDKKEEKKDCNQYVNNDSTGNLDDNSVQQSTVTTVNDPPVINEPNGQNDLSCALDLVKFIKMKFNDYFTIGVAGYPMGHPDAKSYTEDLNYLKEKVDAGGDFIVTQLSFSADQYITFIKDCRAIGIKVPIIPGIFPIQTRVSIRNIAKLTQIEPPEEVKKAINSCNGDAKAISQYGLNHVVDLCSKLINSGLDIPGFHFYTLNRDNCITEILKQLDLWNQRSDQNESTVEPQDINISVLPTSQCEPIVSVESIVS